jgi:hypothetical protein
MDIDNIHAVRQSAQAYSALMYGDGSGTGTASLAPSAIADTLAALRNSK